jgi:hypothetical protein
VRDKPSGEDRMADPSPDSVIVKILGRFIGTAMGTLIGWLPADRRASLGRR